VGDSDAAFVIRGRRRNGAPLYIVSDSDLFANHRLGHADHALLLETLADATRTAGGTMYIDEAFHGYLQSYTPLQNALRGKGAWLSAATLLFLLLILWWALMTPRIKWREFRVVRHNTHTLSSRIGRVVS